MSEVTEITSETATTPSPDLPPQWYALHVLSGQEKKVKESLERRAKTEEMGDLVREIVIPTERVSEVKRGKKIESERKLHPGYVYVNMYLRDEGKKLVERTWYFIRETNGVIGFADGDNPQPIRASEVDTMLGQMREREEKVLPKVAFSVGDKVKVGDGPFQNQEGLIEAVDMERGKLKVSVNMFGRSTSLELEYWQVDKT
ncbi:MAG: transcription termination/antitermination protein NusG [Methylacidiphilales bacterium]|nr:transcription termination/antitermination protein NusG [Candidatus Methylacidiphilales bacterium]